MHEVVAPYTTLAAKPLSLTHWRPSSASICFTSSKWAVLFFFDRRGTVFSLQLSLVESHVAAHNSSHNCAFKQVARILYHICIKDRSITTAVEEVLIEDEPLDVWEGKERWNSCIDAKLKALIDCMSVYCGQCKLGGMILCRKLISSGNDYRVYCWVRWLSYH